MATYKFEAMDTTGGEVKDSVDATNEEEAQQKIRQMGYFVTKLTEVAGKGGKARARPRICLSGPPKNGDAARWTMFMGSLQQKPEVRKRASEVSPWGERLVPPCTSLV